MEKVLQLLEKYQALDIENAVDFKKFNQYLVSHHSTRIEGSTLTYVETTVLLEEGLTPKGKPLVHTLMQKDHYEALLFTLEKSNQLHVTPSLIQEINAHVLRTTGQVYNTVLGQVDATKGEYRKGTVFAGQTTFVNYAKIDGMVKTLCAKINTQFSSSTTTLEKLILSFEAHYELVNIHPFYDGNGRTSRLLSNAIQNYFGLPLAIVHSEDKVEYIEALIASRNADTTLPFLNFMFEQYEKHLENQIQLFQQG
jgi:Fic family protein